jgi:hypothetical protein
LVVINELTGTVALLSESNTAKDLKTARNKLAAAAFSDDLKKTSDTIRKRCSFYEEVMEIAETLILPEHV